MTAAPKPKRGRPRKPPARLRAMVTLTLPRELIDRLDAYAERETRSRSNAVEVLLAAALP